MFFFFEQHLKKKNAVRIAKDIRNNMLKIIGRIPSVSTGTKVSLSCSRDNFLVVDTFYILDVSLGTDIFSVTGNGINQLIVAVTALRVARVEPVRPEGLVAAGQGWQRRGGRCWG